MEANSEVQPLRRRRHSAAFKAEAVQACRQPGVSIAAIALHSRLNANLLRHWVAAQQVLDAADSARTSMIVQTAAFVPLQLDTGDVTAPQEIVIEVRRGAAHITLRWSRSAVIPQLLKRHDGRDYAAKANFCFGGTPPMAMLGRS